MAEEREQDSKVCRYIRIERIIFFIIISFTFGRIIRYEYREVFDNSTNKSKQIRFNELFEGTRSAKRSETSMAIERAERTRRYVDELKQTFCVDASSDLLDVSHWRRIKMSDDRDDFVPVHGDSILRDLAEEEDSPVGKEVQREDVDFRREALDRMMDGVLEVR